mmetsp:Transcript_32442/g.47317  ORF Transcript_32442/g.47317 Transcript_32442/m.47317 type:complete len:176 (-) Transcript_32442:67-594(-)
MNGIVAEVGKKPCCLLHGDENGGNGDLVRDGRIAVEPDVKVPGTAGNVAAVVAAAGEKAALGGASGGKGRIVLDAEIVVGVAREPAVVVGVVGLVGQRERGHVAVGERGLPKVAVVVKLVLRPKGLAGGFVERVSAGEGVVNDKGGGSQGLRRQSLSLESAAAARHNHCTPSAAL